MLSKRQFFKEEQDCASMLGITLEEYRASLKKTKTHYIVQNKNERKYDNSILYRLGLTEKDLKRRKV